MIARLCHRRGHQRGLELHAWFNPIGRTLAKSQSRFPHQQDRPSFVRLMAVIFGSTRQKDVQDYSLSVVMDVVKRYDIDGVHFDDYFYPTKTR